LWIGRFKSPTSRCRLRIQTRSDLLGWKRNVGVTPELAPPSHDDLLARSIRCSQMWRWDQFSSFVRLKGKSDDIVRLARAVEFGSLGGAERKLSKSGGPATRESRRLPSSNRFRTAAAHIATGETATLPALTWRVFVLFRDSTCLCYWRLLHATTALDRARAAVAHGASAVVRFWFATFQSCFTMLADFALHWHAPLT